MRINFIDKRYRVYNKTLDMTYYTRDISEISKIATKQGYELIIYTEKYMNGKWRQIKLNIDKYGNKSKPEIKRHVPIGHVYRVS